MQTAALRIEEIETQTPVDAPRAKILMQEPGAPVQLTLPAREAAALAYIAEDFAKSVVANDDAGDQLVNLATTISSKLRDCLMARAAI